MVQRKKVIMLPTDKASKLHIVPKGEYKGQGKYLERDTILYTDDATEYGYQPVFLYVLSDEEIKDGDWYCDIVGIYTICKADRGLVEAVNKSPKCFKVIASTDKSLWSKGGYSTRNDIYTPFEGAFIRESFIRKYIEAYNAGKPIEWVNVEYDEFYTDTQMPPFYQLKLRNDNSVITHPIKDIFTREDIEAYGKFICDGLNKHFGDILGKFSIGNSVDKWLENY